jgi:hypothetical protein
MALSPVHRFLVKTREQQLAVDNARLTLTSIQNNEHRVDLQKQPSRPGTAVSSTMYTCNGWTQLANVDTTDHRDNKRRRLREDRDRSMASAHDAESIYSVASLDPPTQPPSAMEQAAGMLTDTHESDPMELDEESGNDNDIDMPIRQQTTTSGEVAREKNKAATSAFFTFRDQPKSSRILSAKEKLVASLTARQATESTMPPASASNSINPNTNNSSRQAVVDLNDSESEEDSDGSEVYTVEKILAHNKSDPSSHNKSVHGEKPVMLYLVKWEGYDDTTWEPATSFQDDDVLQEYWSQQAQKQKPSKDTAILKGQRKGL